jgi:DNA-binding NarL/FixJ family response regulator
MHVRVNSVIHILIADDFEAWRVRVRHLLKAQSEWQIVAEAADGLEAIRKTIELRPDIVLLDISMPLANGLEAGGTIFTLWPEAKIIFLSINNDEKVMGSALAMGAKGYVLKANASRELVPTISRALLGLSLVPELR